MPQPLAAGLSTRARLYIGAVITAGLFVSAMAAYDAAHSRYESGWLVLAGLTLLTGSFSIKLPSINARITVSDTFIFAAVILFGSPVATLLVGLDALVLTSWSRGKQRSHLRAVFNLTAAMAAIWVAAHIFGLLLPASERAPSLQQLLLPALALALSYFGINSVLVALAISAETGASAFGIWRQNFAWLSLNYLGGASVAILLVNYTRDIDLTALSLIVPLLVITYLTFRTSLGRLEDAHRHVEQLNQLHLSTIETLAMAVDAKDQITHGHIRRVQVYAVELARRLGVCDERQLKAIEAAALLHDMGKLAIPEYILNKPGKLTSAEFEIMKRHADIGADLLSSIKFPYPVVPIVRHHHEYWDGNGYPTGIAGTDIPLGARILSVVDCFDALNSDRPYRPRLTPEESFGILRDRRGSMYDPLIVDTFIASHSEIAPLAIRAGEQAHSVIPRFDEHHQPPRHHRVAQTSSAFAGLDRALLATDTVDNGVELLLRATTELAPVTTLVLFAQLQGADAVVAIGCAGAGQEALRGLSIKRGERIAGWVAVNRRTVVNSSARLDFGALAASIDPPLQFTIACALITKDGTDVGVLSAYSPGPQPFSNAHKEVLERLASETSDSIAILVAKVNELASLS